MKTANFDSTVNWKNIVPPTGNYNYLTVQYSNQGILCIGWFRQYGSVPVGNAGTSMNVIRFTNFDGTTCDLNLPMSWLNGTSTRKWNTLELPLQSKNIEIISVAAPLNGGSEPGNEQ